MEVDTSSSRKIAGGGGGGPVVVVVKRAGRGGVYSLRWEVCCEYKIGREVSVINVFRVCVAVAVTVCTSGCGSVVRPMKCPCRCGHGLSENF